MASSSVSPINNSSNVDAAQLASLNNNQITSLLVSGNLDPKFVNLLMSQMSENDVNSILFGNDSSSTGFDELGASGLVPSNIPTSSSLAGSDVFAASSPTTSNVTPQFELSVFSQLIGKTVTVVDPQSQKRITSKVASVQLLNGQIVLSVNGILVPTSNIVSIQS